MPANDRTLRQQLDDLVDKCMDSAADAADMGTGSAASWKMDIEEHKRNKLNLEQFLNGITLIRNTMTVNHTSRLRCGSPTCETFCGIKGTHAYALPDDTHSYEQANGEPFLVTETKRLMNCEACLTQMDNEPS